MSKHAATTYNLFAVPHNMRHPVAKADQTGKLTGMAIRATKSSDTSMEALRRENAELKARLAKLETEQPEQVPVTKASDSSLEALRRKVAGIGEDIQRLRQIAAAKAVTKSATQSAPECTAKPAPVVKSDLTLRHPNAYALRMGTGVNFAKAFR